MGHMKYREFGLISKFAFKKKNVDHCDYGDKCSARAILIPNKSRLRKTQTRYTQCPEWVLHCDTAICASSGSEGCNLYKVDSRPSPRVFYSLNHEGRTADH